MGTIKMAKDITRALDEQQLIVAGKVGVATIVVAEQLETAVDEDDLDWDDDDEPTTTNQPVDQIEISVAGIHVMSQNGEPVPFEIHGETIVLKGDTDQLPITGGINLSVGYLHKGVGVQFAPDSKLSHTCQWWATTGEGRCWIGPGKDAKQGTIGPRIANWRESEYTRTGGMDVVVHFPPEADDKTIELFARTPGILDKNGEPLRSNTFRIRVS